MNAIDSNTLAIIESLVIRTLPNLSSKKSSVYDQNNQPPFFTKQAMQWIADSPINHLLVDFPSIDKMYDEGQLINHRAFWKVKKGEQKYNQESKTERTITEMIYVKDHIDDGMYCLNLQIPAFDLDAAPSRPVIYPLNPINNS